MSEDKGNYSVGWDPPHLFNVFIHDRPITNRNYLSPTEHVIRAFQFKNDTKSGGYNFQGKFGSYKSGGYIASLGMTKKEAE